MISLYNWKVFHSAATKGCEDVNPITQLTERFDEFTKSEQKLARYLLDNLQSMMGDPLSDITQRAGSSNAAMVRLCQKLGYKGFSEFRFSMRQALITSAADSPEKSKSSYQDILNTYVRYINQIPLLVGKDEIQRAARTICGAKRLGIWGANRTALSAQMLSHRLRRMGIFNEVSSDSIVLVDNASILSHGDCYIIFSMKGRGIATCDGSIAELAERGCYVILVTMDPKMPAAQKVTQVITLPCPSRDPSPNFLEDQIVVYLFIELLLYEVSWCYQEYAALG